jgi:hypothetical protein
VVVENVTADANVDLPDVKTSRTVRPFRRRFPAVRDADPRRAVAGRAVPGGAVPGGGVAASRT